MPLEQYSLVRVRQLLHPPEYYDGWRINQRPPQVGDVGYLIDILQAPGLPLMAGLCGGGTSPPTSWSPLPRPDDTLQPTAGAGGVSLELRALQRPGG